MNENIPNINKVCVRTEGVAGAGKTTAAIKAIQEYSVNADGNSKGILMFSLTNATIQTLLKRMKYAAPCYTVHSFCLKLLKAQAALAHTQVPKILDSDRAQRCLLEAIALSCPKDDPETVMKAIRDIRTKGKSRKDYPERYGMALDKYIQKLDSLGAADFSRIIELAYLELQKPEIYQRYDGLCVMCDESQDFNPNFEWRVIDILRRRSAEFRMYSSPSQEIYSFAGANYRQLIKTLPDYTDVESLNKSFRCVPEIVEVAKHLGGYDASLMESELEASGYPAVWYESFNHSLALRMIVSTIQDIQEKHPNLTLEDFAVLGRSKNELAKISKELEWYGLRTRMVGSDPNIYKSTGVLRFLDYLNIALTDDERALDNIVNFPNFGIREEDMIPVRGARRLTWKHLENVVGNQDKFSPRVVKRCGFLLNYRCVSSAVLQSDMSDEEKIHKLCDVSEIVKNLADQLAYDEIKKIRRVCDNMSMHRDLGSYFEYMSEQAAKDDAEVGGVNLCNYHSSKGREWDTVFLLENKGSSFCPTEEAEVQALNTAYVASTRAKQRLIISTETDSGYPNYLDFMKSKRQTWF